MPTVTSDEKLARGQRIRKARKSLGMTIIEFAELCQIGESTIRQWE